MHELPRAFQKCYTDIIKGHVMGTFDRAASRLFLLLAALGSLILLVNLFLLSRTGVRSKIDHIHIPGKSSSKLRPAPGSNVSVLHRTIYFPILF